MPHRVAALVFDGLAPFELGIVVEVFGLRRPELGARPWYELAVCSPGAGPLRAVGGLRLSVPHGLEAVAAADTVIVPAWPDADAPVPESVTGALLAAHRRGARLVSICSGAFVLAATGLLDGRRAATHWRYADALRRARPRVRIDERVLYVDEGDILTSAGSAAGLDLCLHLVRRDHGSRVANQVARRLVLAPHREGDQAQFVERPVTPFSDDRLRPAIEWALAHLGDRISVSDLAARAFMSPRTFSRRFHAEVGASPSAWLLGQRLHASLADLEGSDAPVEAVSAGAGLGPVGYRKHFKRRFGVTPTQYRRSFRARRRTGEGEPGVAESRLAGDD